MKLDDEEFLTQVHQNLDKQAIAPTSEFYVAFDKLPGDVLGVDPIPLLARQIRRTTAGSLHFLTGLRGSGKSSQLRRLKRDLEYSGFAVLMLDADEYLNLRRPLGIVDMLLFFVGAMSEHAQRNGWISDADSAQPSAWDRLLDWLKSLRVNEIGITGKIPQILDVTVNLRDELKGNPSFVAQLRDFLNARLGELVTEAHNSVRKLVDAVRENWLVGPWLGLVVIVDSLDHNRAIEASAFHEVRRALANLVDLDADKLQLPDCRTVFTVPSYVKVRGTARKVPNLKVADRNGTANEYGFDALRHVLERRVPKGDLGRIFGTEDQMRRLVRASGGNLRLLLALAMEVITQAETLPVSDDDVTIALDQIRSSLLPLSEDQRTLLRQVAEDHRLPLPSQDAWDVAADLLDQRLVLGYRNGEDWFDVHPLLKDEISDAR